MGRTRKLLANSSGDLTTARKQQKEAEEKAISDWRDNELDEIPTELLDEKAVETWNRLLPDLRRYLMANNLDRDNLISYCNAWSQYCKAIKKLKQNPNDAEYQLTVMKKVAVASDEQRKYGSRLGMDISSRLKFASQIVKKEDDELREEFGDFFE